MSEKREVRSEKADTRQCWMCGCTQNDCSGCVERTGEPCYWITDALCSACVHRAMVLDDVLQERRRHDDKWGEQNHHPFVWLSILGEEVGESHKACLEAEFGDYTDEEWEHLREEVVQVAAVAQACIESIDRNQLNRE